MRGRTLEVGIDPTVLINDNRNMGQAIRHVRRALGLVRGAVLVVLAVALAGSGSSGDTPASVPAAGKQLIPDAAAMKAAQKTVTQVYGPDIAKSKTAEQKGALARKLLKAGVTTTDDAAARYVLLTMAGDMSTGAGELETAIAALWQVGELYKVDCLKLKAEALTKAGAIPMVDPNAMLDAASELVDEAIAAGRMDMAKQSAEAAVSLANKGKDADFVKLAGALAKDVEASKAEAAAAKKASDVLIQTPQDTAANLVVGRFTCFQKRDWETGLPMLVLCGDAALKELAAKELAKPADAQKKVELAGAWADRAEKEKGLVQRHIRQHASQLYKEALLGLTGIAKAKVEQRLQDLADAQVGVAAVKVLSWDDFVAAYKARFPAEKNLAGAGAAAASSHLPGQNPNDVFKDDKLSNAWDLSGSKGWFAAKWTPPVHGRFILLFGKPNSVGEDPWGTAALWTNGKKITIPEMTGGKVAIVDLGSTADIKELRIDIAGKGSPGMTAMEIHKQPIK